MPTEPQPDKQTSGPQNPFVASALTEESDARGEPEPNSPKKTSRGYFQCSLPEAQYVAERGSLNALVAFIVLSWGVSHRNDLPPRVSTHGAKSIHLRSGMSYERAQSALKELLELGTIALPHPDYASTPAQYQLQDSIKKEWVCIDCGFIDGLRSPLRAICTRDLSAPAGKSRISTMDAAKDVLVTFLALHAAQDFGRFGGVDPAVICGDFTPLSEHDTNVLPISDSGEIQGHPLYCVVTAKEPLQQKISKTFGRQTLGKIRARGSKANPEERVLHAISQLRGLKLIYTAHVLWDMHPIKRRRHASPVATLFVKGTPLKQMEGHLQYAVDAALKRTATVAGNEQFFRMDEGRWKSVVEGSGQYRYIVAKRDAGDFLLLSQLRVRWWAFNSDNLAGIERDRQRLVGQGDLLMEFPE